MRRRIFICSVVAALVSVASAFAVSRTASPGEQRVISDALRALNAQGVAFRLSEVAATSTHSRQRELIFTGTSDPESQWKAEVAAGVFAAHGFSLTWISLGAGTMRYRHATGPFAPMSKQQIIATITAAARTAGIRLDAIEMLHPLAYAPVVTITVGDRSRFEKRGGLPVHSLLDYAEPRVEGLFLIVRDAHGHVWSRGGTAIRLGTGAGTWPGSTHG